MKLNPRFISLAAILSGFAIAGSAFAQEPAPQTPPKDPKPSKQPQSQPPKQKQQQPKPHRQPSGQASQLEKQAFLGVASSPLDPSLQSQLGLESGFGLLVRHIQEGSPAEEVLQAHDVLIKLDDQKLINQDQLAVLVRAAGKDAQIKLTVFRGGKEETVEVTLTEREVPVHGFFGNAERSSNPGAGISFHIPMPTDQGPGQPFGFDPQQVEREMRQMRQDIERRIRDQHQGQNQNRGPRPPEFPGGVDVRIETHSSSNGEKDQDSNSATSSSTMRKATWVENDVVMSLSDDGKSKTLTIDKGGKRVFDGKIDTDAQLEKIPEEVRENVERLLKRLKVGPKPAAAAGGGAGGIF